MSFYPKLIGAVCGVCAAGVLIYAGVSALDKAGVSADGILSSKPTLTVWYTEEKLEDYLSAMALEYQNETGVRVVPVLKSGLEYLEAVNDASLVEVKRHALVLGLRSHFFSDCIRDIHIEADDLIFFILIDKGRICRDAGDLQCPFRGS